jgi:hypothetical protein
MWPDALFHETFQANNGWSLRDYWLRSTFGLLRLEFDFSIANWWRLDDQTHAALKDDRGGILAAARRVVEVDNGISLARFNQVIAFVHAPPCNAGAIGGGAVFDQGGTLPFFEHELGHVLGFQHAFGPFIPPPNEFGNLYNDPYCVMGYTGVQSHPIPQPAAFMQTQILHGANFWRSERRASAAAVYRRFSGTGDFVNSGWVAHTATGGRVWIGSLTETTNTAPIVAVLPIPAQPEAQLTVEYRTSVGDDAGVAQAVVVHSIGAREVGLGRDEVNPPWFEGTLAPVVGSSFETLGVRFEVVTVFTGQPAGVEIQTGAPLGFSTQGNWRWCNKCQGLFFGGDVAGSRCPTGGTHAPPAESRSGNYSLPHEAADDPSRQSDWRWCNKCQGLFFGGDVGGSHCPAGGTHAEPEASGSGNYSLPHVGA